MKIAGFQGEYRFLSNFWPVGIDYKGRRFTSTEIAYQASKAQPSEFATVALQMSLMSPGQAKRFARTITLREDWDAVKVDIMLDLQREKYKDLELKAKLLATGDAYLEETNTWGDRFWGVCNGIGRNELGFILMKVREELRA